MTGRARTSALPVAKTPPPLIPDYLNDTYRWAYLRPASIRWFDNSVAVAAILWGNYWRLSRAAVNEFSAGEHVLQAACAYGRLSPDLARRIGASGRLEVVDIVPIQVENCRRKLAGQSQAQVRLADASAPGGGPYDGVCCYFLLHELPDAYKRKVVAGLLDVIRPGGRVVFVDYHRPSARHPLRGVMNLIFRWLEPFAFSLLAHEIVDFAPPADDISWRKVTYFGGLYQKVIAERRID